MIAMFEQKGFSSPLLLLLIALIGVSFYAGLSYQKQLTPSTTQSTATSTPENSNKPATPIATPRATIAPTATPTPPPVSDNTSDSSKPTLIKVGLPNGGESFKVGESVHITWSSNNLYKSGSCVVTLLYETGAKSTAWVPVNTPNGYFDWILPAEAGNHQAKVHLECYDSTSNRVEDQSDNFFTVIN